MKQIIDQGIILIYCMLSLTFVSPEYNYILAFLLIIIYTGINSYLTDRLYSIITTICLIIIGLFVPEILFFIPVSIYGLLKNKLYILGIIELALYMYYWSGIALISIVFILLGILLSCHLFFRTDKLVNLEKELIRIRDDNTESTISLKEKNKALLENQDYRINNATLRERNRIAREIHDNVGHMLSRAILMTGALLATTKEESTKSQAAALSETLDTAMSNIRESVHDLHDESVNLEDSAKELIKAFTFCAIEFEFDMSTEVIREVKYAFLAILKEGLNNVIKHSDADKVIVSMVEHPAMYQMTIWDNGDNIKRNIGKKTGIGLMNMEDRIENLKGKLRIHTDDGFRLFITIPKEMERE